MGNLPSSLFEKSPQPTDFREGIVADEAAFEAALQAFVQTAAQNGIAVPGGWHVESPSSEFPDWEVVITEFADRTENIDPTEE